jgi:hypothetical protein
VSIVFGLQLMGVGFLIYFFYSRKREVRARTGMRLVLFEQHKSKHRSNFRILVPMANPQTQPALFAISESLLPENYTAEQKAHSSKILVEAIRHHGAKSLYRIEVTSSDRPLDFLVERSADFDLLVVGATKVNSDIKSCRTVLRLSVSLRNYSHI